jgi:hypothetical protein
MSLGLTLDQSIVSVVVLAVVLANVPFFNSRRWFVGAVMSPKPIWMELIELSITYLVVGLVAFALEHQAGRVFRQGWEFYAVTLSLFMTLAFPGFVYRHLRRS